MAAATAKGGSGGGRGGGDGAGGVHAGEREGNEGEERKVAAKESGRGGGAEDILMNR